jgi:hypothetical protein
MGLQGWIFIALSTFCVVSEGTVVDLTPLTWERYVIQAEHGKDTVVLFYDNMRSSFKSNNYAHLANSFPDSSVAFAALDCEDIKAEDLPPPFNKVAHDKTNAQWPAMFFFRKGWGKQFETLSVIKPNSCVCRA